MKELKAKPKVTQAMTRDGLTLENKATGEVENISSREAEQDYTPEAGGTAEKLLERANDAHGPAQSQENRKTGRGYRRRGETAAHRPSSRLQLSEEERADPALQPYIQKAGGESRQTGCSPRRSAEKACSGQGKSLRCCQRQGKIHPAF